MHCSSNKHAIINRKEIIFFVRISDLTSEKISEKNNASIFKIGEVAQENINLNSEKINVADLQKISQLTFEKNFS